MSCYHIDFVALDLAFKNDRRTAINDPLTQLLDHRLDIISVHVEFLGDLQTREIQTHEVQANNPGAQGLMMAGEDGSSEVVKPPLTSVAEVSLPVRLGVITAVLDDGLGRAMGAYDAVGPSHIADGLEALGVVDEVADVDHVSIL